MEDSAGRAPDDDAALIELAQRGSRYALALTHDRADAEDLVHEALLTILRTDKPRTAPYFFTVIRARFVDQRRRAGSLILESFEERAEAGLTEALEVVEQPVDDEQLTRALGRLSHQEREVLMLSCVEELSCAQIAEIFDRPRGTITSLLHRAKQKLERILQRGSPESSP